MRFRLVCGACVLALTGCFADPPAGGGGDDGSTSAAGTSTTESPTSTGSADETSTGLVEGSSTTAADGSSGGVCEEAPFEPPVVPADIIVLVDQGLSTPFVQSALDELQGVTENNVAIIAPATMLSELVLETDCPQGCETAGCAMPANRVIVPYTDTAYEALTDLASFDCIIREPAAGTSGPVANLWFLTEDPMQQPPKNLGMLVLEGELRLRVHVACPGCDQDLFNANSLLEQIVSASGGSVSNLNVPMVAVGQGTYIGRPRYSCAWDPAGEPDYYRFESGVGDIDPIVANPVESQAECDDAPAFHPEEGVGVRLCPDTCRPMQALPVDSLDVYACE